MKIAVRHHLSLGLGPGVARGIQHLLLTPQSGPTQTVLDWSIDMPGIAGAARFADGFANRALLVTQLKPEPELIIRVSGLVETIDRNGVIGRPAGDIPPAVYRRQTAATKPIGAITARFRAAPRTGADRIPLLHTLMARVSEVISGADKAQSQSQSQDESTQSQVQGTEAEAATPPAADYAHAFVGAARALDIPTRYVSGYLYGAEDGATALHAWAEAWDDGLGWIAFDPMLGYCPTERHIKVAVGLDAATTVPVRSVPILGQPASIEVAVEAAQ